MHRSDKYSDSRGGYGKSSFSGSSYDRRDYGTTNSRSSYSYGSKHQDDYRSSKYSNSSSRYDENKYSSHMKRTHKGSPISSRDIDRKRSRNDDTRAISSYSSSSYRRPKTPPPPSIRSNYHQRDNIHRNDNRSMGYSTKRYESPKSKKHTFSSRSTIRRPMNRIRPRIPNTREIDGRRRIIRRKFVVSSSRRLPVRTDRSRAIRVARMKRNRDSIRIKSSRVDDKKGRDSESKHSSDEFSSKKRVSTSQNKEDAENKDIDNKIKERSESKEKEGKDTDKSKDKNTEKPIKHSDVDSDKSGDEDNESVSPKKSTQTKTRKVEHESPKSSYIKLVCVHCHMKCEKFTEYQNHLYSRGHRSAMRRVGLRQRALLSRMRLLQRNAQREIEDNSKEEDLGEQQYCLLCRLNYRQQKAKHQLSEHHKKMKKFLMPYCGTCHISFKSPLVYESHRCSLDHIKRKYRDNKSQSEESEHELEVNMRNYKTVDSIGEIDDYDFDDESDAGNDEDIDKEFALQFVDKVEALFCRLCKTYFENNTDNDDLKVKHCNSRSHLKLVRQFKEKDQQTNVKDTESSIKQEENLENEEKKPDVDDDNNETKKNGESNWEDIDKEMNEDFLQGDKDIDGNNDEDEDDEAILNIDIQSEKKNKAKEIDNEESKS